MGAAILFSSGLFAQKTPYPTYYVQSGLGIGANYGLFGTKTIVGKNGSGLLLSLGTGVEGDLGYQVGGQVCAKWWYLNAAYGVYGHNAYSYRGEQLDEAMKGVTVMMGGMINIGKPKRFFIDLGVGGSFGYTYKNPFTRRDEHIGGVSFAFGAGYRIGGYKKN